MPTISDANLKELLAQENCSSDFIEDALRYKSYYKGDIDSFIDKVEELLYALENSDDDDEEFDDEEFLEDDDVYDDDLFDEIYGDVDSDPDDDDHEDDEENEHKRPF